MLPFQGVYFFQHEFHTAPQILGKVFLSTFWHLISAFTKHWVRLTRKDQKNTRDFPTWRIIPVSKGLITMVNFRPISRVVPLPNGLFMTYKRGWSLTTYIHWDEPPSRTQPPLPNHEKTHPTHRWVRSNSNRWPARPSALRRITCFFFGYVKQGIMKIWTQQLKQWTTLQEINISHLGKRKIIFKYAILGGYVNSLQGIHVGNSLTNCSIPYILASSSIPTKYGWHCNDAFF